MSVFSLFVDLKANTADFVSGMSTASYAAKKAGREIEDSFSRLGSVASAALAPFGELGATIGESLGRIGEYAEVASSGISKLGGGMSELAVGGGVVAGAMVAVGAATIGVAIRAAESAAQLGHMAQATGVSVETLSRFGYVARQTGVDTQAMDTGLERLSKSAFAAASAPAGAVNAYSRLGISVRDAAGNVRQVGDVFLDVAQKFSQMPDGLTKSALAMQLFGRSGDALIPLLDRGRDGIAELAAEADRLGVTINSSTSAASIHLEENFGFLKEAATGAANRLMDPLMPALLAVTKAMGDEAEATGQSASATAKWASDTIGELSTVFTYLQQFVNSMQFLQDEANANGRQIHDILAHAFSFDFSGAAAAARSGTQEMEGIYAKAVADQNKLWADHAAFLDSLNPKPKSGFDIAEDWFKNHPAPGGGANTAQPTIGGIAGKDDVADLVAKLAAQASAEISLAGAIQQSVAAMTLAKAAGEADVKIAETRTALLDREKTLREQLAAAQHGAHPEEAGRFTEEIAAVDGYLKELDRDAPLIRERYIEIAASKLAVSANEELGKETLTFDSQIASLSQFVAAYKQGGAAIAAADIGKQLEGDREKVAGLAEAYAIFAATEPENVTALAQLGSGLLQANAALDAHAGALQQIRSLSISEQIAKDTRAFQDQIPALRQLGAAYGQGADAVRAAEVSLKVADFEAKNPGASADQIAQVTALYQEQSNVAHAGAIAQEAAQYNLNQSLADELEKLNQIREVLQGNGASTLAVDAAIYDAQRKSLEQWDAAAIKVGTLADKYKAFLNEIQLAGQDLGGKIFSSFSKAVDDVSTQLAKLVVTGKSNFRELFQSLEESIVKAGIQSAFSQLTKGLGGGSLPGSSPNAPGGTAGTLPGGLGIGGIAGIIGKVTGLAGATSLSGRPDGSALNPFFVVMASAAAATPGSNVGSTSVIGSLFGGSKSTGLLSTPDGSQANPFYVISSSLAGSSGAGAFSFLTNSGDSTSDSSGGGLGGLFTDAIGSIFGGGLAEGGDMTPGKAYLVGEKHPEILFAGRNGGKVVPSLSAPQGTKQINLGGVHFHGVTDADSFQHSSSQIMAQFQRAIAIAHARNY